jgi:UrcA family protein
MLLEQNQQQIKGAAAQLNGLALSAQHPLRGVDLKCSDAYAIHADDYTRWSWRGHSSNSSKFQGRFKTQTRSSEILYPRAAVSLKAQRNARNQQWEIAMKNLTTLIAVAGFTAVLCANAQAGVHLDVNTEAVRYTTPNADNAAAVAKLYRRIDAAAGKVCGERLMPGSFLVSKSWQGCVQSAMSNALAKINIPAVTAYAAARGVVGYDSTIARN